MNKVKKIVILGSTGSIGRQTLQIIDAFPDKFQVVALAGGENIQLLAEQVKRYQPDWIATKLEKDADKLKRELGDTANFLSGRSGLTELASLEDADCVVVALSGISGLFPTLKALENGKRVALANKETLVCAGQIVKGAIRYDHQLLPVDSEHSAVFQCMEENGAVEKIILTASGGPFRSYSLEQMQEVTPSMALKHPNWSMGRKISIDSATMMNKGLEVIEAFWLFNLNYDMIDVVIHPQSIVHSMVSYQDGSLLAHLGLPDMRIPIQYALSWPKRWHNDFPRMDLAAIGQLTFEAVDEERFAAVRLAYTAGREGGVKPTALNAANEEAVAAFLRGRITFLEIIPYVEQVVDETNNITEPTLTDVLTVDKWARRRIMELVAR